LTDVTHSQSPRGTVSMTTDHCRKPSSTYRRGVQW
jgi:hypothetical protein